MNESGGKYVPPRLCKTCQRRDAEPGEDECAVCEHNATHPRYVKGCPECKERATPHAPAEYLPPYRRFTKGTGAVVGWILGLALLVGEILGALWLGGKYDEAQLECVDAKMAEAYDRLRGIVYSDDHWREEAELDCKGASP